jgi:hypothetical protein
VRAPLINDVQRNAPRPHPSTLATSSLVHWIANTSGYDTALSLWTNLAGCDVDSDGEAV